MPVISVLASTLTPQTTLAYKCVGTATGSFYNEGKVYDNDTNPLYKNYVQNQTYQNGSCVVTVPDEEYTPSGNSGSQSCEGGDPLIDGRCYTMRTLNTTTVPIKGNGTNAAADAWGCGAGDKYNASTHTCDEQDCGSIVDPCEKHAPSERVADDSDPGTTQTTYTCTDRTVNPPTTYTVAKGQKCKDGSNPAATVGGSGTGIQGSSGSCGGAKTNLISCDGSGVDAIGNVLKMILTIMSVGVGVLAVGGFVYAAILYASAQDNASQTKKAIEVVTNVVIGLLLYLFMVAIVNWLVPGGVIG